MGAGLRISVIDLETGEEESREINDDWCLTVAGNRYLANRTDYANGTFILVVKRDPPTPASERHE